MKEQELKKSFSQMSLEERKTKKVSQKNSTRKNTVSTAATERTSLQQTEEQTRPSNKRESMEFLLKFFLHATKSLVTSLFSYKNSSVLCNLFPMKLRVLRISLAECAESH